MTTEELVSVRTGDVQLTLAQSVALSGVVVVTTPKSVVLEDSARAIHLCRQMDVSVLGLVENMSIFLCPNCGVAHDLFGSGGGRDLADRMSVSFLGVIPIEEPIRKRGDMGGMLTAADPGSDTAQAIKEMGAVLAGFLGLDPSGCS